MGGWVKTGQRRLHFDHVGSGLMAARLLLLSHSLVNRAPGANDAAVLIESIESAVRTLPLYDPSPADADGWHAVRSPGGYEWWNLDAEDESGQLRLVASLGEGFAFHPGYLRRYYRFLADPTRHSPPLPGEYPFAYFAVYEKGRILAACLTLVRPGQFSASSYGPQVRVAANQLGRSPDGSLRLTLSGPRLSGELVFTPMFGNNVAMFPSPGTPGEGQGEGLSRLGETECPMQKSSLERATVRAPFEIEGNFLSRKMTGADHRWVIAKPLCRVRGEIHLGAVADGGPRRLIGFSGLGFHDHNFGSAPLGPGLRRWMRGRMLWDNGMFAFQYARGRRKRMGDELTVVQADADGMREVPVTLTRTDWSGRTALAVRYPTRLCLSAVGGAPGEIRLESPCVVHSTCCYLRLTYEARFGQRTGQAFCEVGYPRRLTWPVVGRIIERSLQKRPDAP
jgi:hypothetical protein